MAPQDIGRAAVATAVDLTLTAVRLPITVTERVLGERLPIVAGPVRAVTAAQATVLSGVAELLHDDRLAGRAKLLADSAERAGRAAELQAEAEQLRDRKVRVLAEAREGAEERRREAYSTAEEQRRAIEKGADKAEDRVEAKARQAEAEADEAAERRARSARRSTRTARREAVEAEARAVEAQEEAIGAATVVDALDEEVDRARQRRRRAAERG